MSDNSRSMKLTLFDKISSASVEESSLFCKGPSLSDQVYGYTAEQLATRSASLEMGGCSYLPTTVDRTKCKQIPTPSTSNGPISFGCTLCLWDCLSPTTSVIAGGVGAPLPARSAVGFNLNCVSMDHTFPRARGRATLRPRNFDMCRIDLTESAKNRTTPQSPAKIRCFVNKSARFAEPAIRRRTTFPDCTCCCSHRSATSLCLSFSKPRWLQIPLQALLSARASIVYSERRSPNIDCVDIPSALPFTAG